MLQGYRTYIIAAIMAVGGVMVTFDWVAFFNDPKAGIMMLLSAVVMAFLRSITTTPPGLKTEDVKVVVKEEVKEEVVAEIKAANTVIPEVKK